MSWTPLLLLLMNVNIGSLSFLWTIKLNWSDTWDVLDVASENYFSYQLLNGLQNQLVDCWSYVDRSSVFVAKWQWGLEVFVLCCKSWISKAMANTMAWLTYGQCNISLIPLLVWECLHDRILKFLNLCLECQDFDRIVSS